MNSCCLSTFRRNCSKMGNKKTNRIKNSSARANEKPAEQDVQSQRQIKRRYQQQDSKCCVVPPVFLEFSPACECICYTNSVNSAQLICLLSIPGLFGSSTGTKHTETDDPGSVSSVCSCLCAMCCRKARRVLASSCQSGNQSCTLLLQASRGCFISSSCDIPSVASWQNVKGILWKVWFIFHPPNFLLKLFRVISVFLSTSTLSFSFWPGASLELVFQAKNWFSVETGGTGSQLDQTWLESAFFKMCIPKKLKNLPCSEHTGVCVVTWVNYR